VLGRIRSDRLLQSLPVVVVTSSDEERDLVESYKLAANAYVRKPVEFAELVEAFRQLGIYWLAINPDSERRGN
jgi:two-component system response regulator